MVSAVNVAMPAMQADLHLKAVTMTWVLAIYLLAMTVRGLGDEHLRPALERTLAPTALFPCEGFSDSAWHTPCVLFS